MAGESADDSERVGWLVDLSNRIVDLGRREEALAAIEEAAGIYRQLAQARPDAFLPDLATALNNLARALSSLDRPAEASVIREEANAAIGTLARLSADRASEETNAQPSDP